MDYSVPIQNRYNFLCSCTVPNALEELIVFRKIKLAKNMTEI